MPAVSHTPPQLMRISQQVPLWPKDRMRLMSEALSEPCDGLFLTVVTTGTVSIDVRLGTQPLLAFIDVELRHGHGIPEEAVASENG
jgi:hypothetical protein